MRNSKFLKRPTLGGWLSIFNGVAVVAYFFPPIHFHRLVDSDIGLIAFWALTVPFAWCAFIPQTMHGPTLGEVIARCFAVGLNSFIWGYGLAAIIRVVSAGIQRLRARLRRGRVDVDLAPETAG